MSVRTPRTGMGMTNSGPNSPERSLPGSPSSPLRHALAPLRTPRSIGDGMRIPPFVREPSSPQDRAGAQRFLTPGMGLGIPATPRGEPGTPRSNRGKNLLRRPSDDILRSRPRTHASGDQEAPLSARANRIFEPNDQLTMNLSSSCGKPNYDAQVLKIDNRADADVEKQIKDLKIKFLNKNEAKKTSLQDVFRVADVHKMGSIGREELNAALDKIGVQPGEQVVDHLLSTRAANKERLSFHDFMRFFDDRSGNMSLLKRPKKAIVGDCSKMAHLWVPTKPEVLGCREVGTLNDVLEADKREDGHLTERLDGNFSGVQYNILNFDSSPRPNPPSVIIPIKKRDTLFAFPNPHGRKVNFDHGDTPWNVVTVRTPRSNKRTTILGEGALDQSFGADTWRRQTCTNNVPVRLHAFTQIHGGGLPTQSGMALGIMTPVVV